MNAPGVGPSAWWKVAEDGQVMAGPFMDKVDALMAAAPPGRIWDLPPSPNVVFGARRNDGTVESRPSAEDRAWEAYLDDQLVRITDPSGAPLDQHPLGQLTREVGTALVEVGFELHCCAAQSPGGGVCVFPTSGEPAGVAVAWTQHDRMAMDHVRGWAAYQDVQDMQNQAVADVLMALGFAVKQLGQGGAHVVTGYTDLQGLAADLAEVDAEQLPPLVVDATEDPETCQHQGTVYRDAGVGWSGDVDDSVPWARFPMAPQDLDGYRMRALLGRCSLCGSRLVKVATWDGSEPWEPGGRSTEVGTSWVRMIPKDKR